MTDLEARLQRALAADAPPEPDPLFRVEVIMRRERRALHKRLAAAGAVALAAAVLTPLMIQTTDDLLGASHLRLLAIAVEGAALAALFIAPYVGGGRMMRALGARLGSTFTGR